MNPFLLYLAGPGTLSLIFKGYHDTANKFANAVLLGMSEIEKKTWANIAKEFKSRLNKYDDQLYKLIVDNQENLSIDLSYSRNFLATDLTRRQYHDSLGVLVHYNYIVRTNLKEGRYWINPLLFMDRDGEFILIKPDDTSPN